MKREELVRSLWDAVHRQDWERLADYFAPDARILWYNTAEQFTVEEFVEVNRSYPGDWTVALRRVERFSGGAVSAVRVCCGEQSFHATSFFRFRGNRIALLEEYWGDDGPPPAWRRELGIGRAMGEGRVEHTLEPVYDERSRVLILGTMPSPESRRREMYYGHPQNRFWKVLERVLDYEIPPDLEGRRQVLRDHRIALWDVLQSCAIDGAEDASIRDPVPNDLSRIFTAAGIAAVFTTGKKAYQLYDKLFAEQGFPAAVCLPSTSPANGRFSLERLVEEYRAILPYLNM